MGYTNCECCGIELQPDEILTPCYDDGGGLDSFDVQLKWPSHPYCEGCDSYFDDPQLPQDTYDGELPF